MKPRKAPYYMAHPRWYPDPTYPRHARLRGALTLVGEAIVLCWVLLATTAALYVLAGQL